MAKIARMANRSSGQGGLFLKASDREALLTAFAKYEKRKNEHFDQGTNNAEQPEKSDNDGCRVCMKDNDHAAMLICEGCNAEYHFYCIGLRDIPSDDWFCDRCEPEKTWDESDGLDLKVAALPPNYTSRFGEIVYAQGGSGYGMWPCYIYDPRMTIGGARELAKKNLGKKHLVYFLCCHEAPFAALPDSKIVEWYEGLTENYHLGKAAKHNGKSRARQFSEALRVANLELGKRVEQRMDWNHPDPKLSPSPAKKEVLKTPTARRQSIVDKKEKRKIPKLSNVKKKICRHNTPLRTIKETAKIFRSHGGKSCTRSNLLKALAAHNEAVKEVGGELYLRVIRRDDNGWLLNVGFVKFGSRENSTFADARQAMTSNLDPGCLTNGEDWKFYIPELGPISLHQESSLGPLSFFLQKASGDPQLGDGTIRKPIKVVVVKIIDMSTLIE